MSRTYAGIPQEYHDYRNAKVVLQPVAYDGTSTWGKGADKGPEAFLTASENMELYHIETKSEVYKEGIHLASDLASDLGPFSSPEAMTEAVAARTRQYLAEEKFVTLFGGEHSVSIGTIRAHAEKYPGLTVVQLDAHADLRPEYLGSSCNHACALYESSKRDNLLQVGIRSMDALEEQHMDRSKVWFASAIWKNTDWIAEVVAACTEHIYVTIDLDGFDSGLVPSTGTPEPGGLQWWPTMELLEALAQKGKVVGFDIVELAPQPSNKAPDFLAAKLYYNFLSYCFNPN